MTISSIPTWVVLKVLEVDVGDVLVLHQVHLQVVLRAMHLVVGACKILPSISILFAGELSWSTDEMQFVSNRRKAPTEAEDFGEITGSYPNDFAQLANGIWLWVSFEKYEKPGKSLQERLQLEKKFLKTAPLQAMWVTEN